VVKKLVPFLAINDEDMPAAQIINTFFISLPPSMKRFHFVVSVPFFSPPSCYKKSLRTIHYLLILTGSNPSSHK
jgi:hypothetical protein